MIDLPNPFTESACPQADTPTVAASSRPDESPAAAVTPSSSLEVATTAPGMAHSDLLAAGKRPVPSVSLSSQGEQERDTTGVTAGETALNSDPLAIPDFLRRVRIKPEGEAAVITKANENIAGAKQ